MTSKPVEPPLPWPAEMRPGDELRLRVVHDVWGSAVPAVLYVSSRSYPPLVLIEHVRTATPIEVGVLVERHATGSRGRVRGLTGRWAWVEWSTTGADSPTTVPVEHLTVVEEPTL